MRKAQPSFLVHSDAPIRNPAKIKYFGLFVDLTSLKKINAFVARK
jgi:hypothetical protein